MKLIGITGGIGAGKSAVLDYLRNNYQATVILADLVAQDIMAKPGQGKEQLKATFGKRFYQEDGKLNKEVIRKEIFKNQQALAKLNDIVHPLVKQEIQKSIEQARQEGQVLCVVEAALLLEENYDDFCDQVWYIYTTVDNRQLRLMTSRGYSKEQCQDIMATQLSEQVFRNRCQVVIDNNRGLASTYAQVDGAIANLQKEKD